MEPTIRFIARAANIAWWILITAWIADSVLSLFSANAFPAHWEALFLVFTRWIIRGLATVEMNWERR